MYQTFGISGTGIVKTGGVNGSANSVAIVVAGTTNSTGGGYWQVVRYNSNGSLDSSFGTSGVTTGSGLAHSVALQSDGKLVVAGQDNTPAIDTL